MGRSGSALGRDGTSRETRVSDSAAQQPAKWPPVGYLSGSLLRSGLDESELVRACLIRVIKVG